MLSQYLPLSASGVLGVWTHDIFWKELQGQPPFYCLLMNEDTPVVKTLPPSLSEGRET